MARAAAKAGDVFGPDMTPHFQRILAEDWNSRSAADRKALFRRFPKGLQLVDQPAVSDDASPASACQPSCWPSCRCCPSSSIPADRSAPAAARS